MITNVKRSLLVGFGAILVLSAGVFFSQVTRATNYNDYHYGPKRDASASVTKTQATCESPAKLKYGPATYATYTGTANNTTGPLAHYAVTATAAWGHVFVNGSDTLSFYGSLEDKKAQSSDPHRECFNPPALTPIVKYSEWKDGEILCGKKTVTQTRTKTVTTRTYVKDRHGNWSIEYGTPIVTSETGTRRLHHHEIVDCPVEPILATASVKILNATCKVGETLVYSNVQNAFATEGSTPDGTVGAPTNYSVTFVANKGAEFADEADTTFKGTLAGPLTDPSCETGDVLGDTTKDGTGTASPAKLPNTSGEATVAIALGGILAVAVIGLASARRLFARSL